MCSSDLLEDSLKADPDMAGVKIRLPAPYRNPDWSQAGGHPSHAMHHLALADQVAVRWTADAGTGSSSQRRVTAAPITGGGLVYTLDNFHTIESHYERRAQLAREQGTVLRIREAERQLLLKMTGIYQQVGALPEQNAVHFASLKGMSTAYRDVAKQNADAIADRKSTRLNSSH